ncbi:hypothetical protein PUNSTDRAFT_29058, partial [Punctularia strigosozonata HHB-11173 SS5]|uniref:uncharacterized protein n=1 Tax=Punctularia strigosozonata (strain HHB-11173) TaxID=741275 RepID=UPI00044180F8
ARNLVVCIDGTANQFSEKNTNVVELYSRLIKDDDQQLTYYNSGIGTYARETKTFKYWRQAIDHTVDMAIAWNFKKIVLDAYQWLSENYKPGDRIFLFGFSRGAYQVRVIAAMIEMVGLLHKGNNGQIEFAYELYMATTALLRRISGLPPAPRDPEVNQNTSDVNTKAPPLAVLQRDEPDHGRTSKSSKPVKSREGKGKGKADPLELSDRFKRTLCRPNVKVHFVGAWDTVSSIGVARGPSLPETTMGMKHVCVFRHALALDEVRVKFLPEYANGGAGP